jgi:hypothetical protein
MPTIDTLVIDSAPTRNSVGVTVIDRAARAAPVTRMSAPTTMTIAASQPSRWVVAPPSKASMRKPMTTIPPNHQADA